MLILTRKKNESIYIGNNQEIKVVVLDIFKHVIKIGIEADKSINIVREEIFKPNSIKFKKEGDNYECEYEYEGD